MNDIVVLVEKMRDRAYNTNRKGADCSTPDLRLVLSD